MSEKYEDPQWSTQAAPSFIGAYGKTWNAEVQLDGEAPFFSLVDEPGYQAVGYTERHETHGTTLQALLVKHGIAKTALALEGSGLVTDSHNNAHNKENNDGNSKR